MAVADWIANGKCQYRNGEPATVLCTDRPFPEYPIVTTDDRGALWVHRADGASGEIGHESEYDLVPIPADPPRVPLTQGDVVTDVELTEKYLRTDALAIIRCHAETLGAKHNLPMSRELLLSIASDVENLASRLNSIIECLAALRRCNDAQEDVLPALCPNRSSRGDYWDVIDAFKHEYTPIGSGATPSEAIQLAVEWIRLGY